MNENLLRVLGKMYPNGIPPGEFRTALMLFELASQLERELKEKTALEAAVTEAASAYTAVSTAPAPLTAIPGPLTAVPGEWKKARRAQRVAKTPPVGALAPQEAASRAGVTLQTVYAWIRKKRLPIAAKVGRTYYVTREAVDAAKKG
jgi:excisionase family DNA binding protein